LLPLKILYNKLFIYIFLLGLSAIGRSLFVAVKGVDETGLSSETSNGDLQEVDIVEGLKYFFITNI